MLNRRRCDDDGTLLVDFLFSFTTATVESGIALSVRSLAPTVNGYQTTIESFCRLYLFLLVRGDQRFPNFFMLFDEETWSFEWVPIATWWEMFSVPFCVNWVVICRTFQRDD